MRLAPSETPSVAENSTGTDDAVKEGDEAEGERARVECDEKEVPISSLVVKSVLDRVITQVFRDAALRQLRETNRRGYARVRYDHKMNPDKVNATIFDSHCHLTRLLDLRSMSPDCAASAFTKFRAELPKEFGSKFEGCITVFDNPLQWSNSERLFRVLDDSFVYGTFGCHPLMAKDFDMFSLKELRRCLNHSKAVALGEIGLDFHWKRMKKAEKERQIKVFKLQLDLARELGKPVCLHIRGADEEALKIMAQVEFPRDWLLHYHCCSIDWATCFLWMKEWPQMTFGFTPDYFHREVVEKIPMDKLLLETDAPYFRPIEMRRSRSSPHSHPGLVFHTALQLAEVKQVSVDCILTANRNNIKKIYGV